MRTLFISFLVLVLFLLVYSHKLPGFETITNITQDFVTGYKKFRALDIRVNNNTNTVTQENYVQQDSMQIAPDSSDILDISKPKIEIMMNPLVEKLLEIETNDVNQFFSRHILKLEKSDKLIMKSFFFTSGIMFLLMLLTSRTFLSWFSFFLAKLGFTLSSILIFMTVFLTPVSWFIFKYNLFNHMNGIFFIGPLALFVSSTVSLKIYDFNNPIWNRLIFSFASLTVAAIIVRVF